MARHNREGEGTDQRGYGYAIRYQPDWLRVVKVTRRLETGRQSTMTLFKNPGVKEAEPGDRVRTRIRSEEQGLDVEVALTDPDRVVRRVVVECVAPTPDGKEEAVAFTLIDELPAKGDGGA